MKDTFADMLAWRPRLTRGAVFGVLAAAVMVVPAAVYAGTISDFFLGAAASFFKLLAELAAALLTMEIRAMMAVAQYSNFVNPGPTAVRVGWVVTRDLANMFFILILLVIAFGTIVGKEEYGYKKLLPRLLITTVVINFSKTICGILIDFGQVIMLTFVNGFIQAAGGNFLRAFQVDKLTSLDSAGDISQGGLVISMALAFILLSIAAVVILVMLIIITWRIIMLWLLIIMSPIAFLANTIGHAGEGYYKQWWDKFKKQIIAGPLLAFFLWLALISVQTGGGNIAQADGFAGIKTAADIEVSAQVARQGGFTTEVSRTDLILSFVIAICLLMGGLQLAIESSDGLAKELGGSIAKYPRKALNAVTGGITGLGKGAVDKTYGAAKTGVKTTVGLATSPFRWAGRRGKESAQRSGGRALAKVPLLNRFGRSQAAKGDAARAARLKAKYGSEKLSDVAKLSPKQFNKFAGKAAPEEAAEFSQIYQNNPALLAEAQRTGAAKNLAEGLRKQAKPDKDGNFTDAAGARAYNDFMKANWAEETDSEKRKKIFKGMSDDESLRYLNAGNIVPQTVNEMDKSNLAAIMSKGTPQQQSALATVLENMEKNKSGTVENFLRTKGMTAAQVPAGFLNANVDVQRPGGVLPNVAGGDHFANSILRAGRRDPSVASKMAENPKMADRMGQVALADMKNMQLDRAAGKPVNNVEFNSAVNVAIQTGKLTASDIQNMKADLVATFDVKDLASMVRYAPSENRDIQEALREAVTAIHASGGEVAQRIAQNPNLAEYIRKAASQGASQAAAQATPAAPAASPAPSPGGQEFRGAGAYSRNQRGRNNT